MSYMFVYSNYRRLLAGGLLLTLFSGFGQSFFISIFTLNFLNDFSLDRTIFGLIYAIVTLLSGLLLPWVGGLLDRQDPIRYTVFAALGLTAVLVIYFHTICCH